MSFQLNMSDAESFETIEFVSELSITAEDVADALFSISSVNTALSMESAIGVTVESSGISMMFHRAYEAFIKFFKTVAAFFMKLIDKVRSGLKSAFGGKSAKKVVTDLENVVKASEVDTSTEIEVPVEEPNEDPSVPSFDEVMANHERVKEKLTNLIDSTDDLSDALKEQIVNMTKGNSSSVQPEPSKAIKKIEEAAKAADAEKKPSEPRGASGMLKPGAMSKKETKRMKQTIAETLKSLGVDAEGIDLLDGYLFEIHTAFKSVSNTLNNNIKGLSDYKKMIESTAPEYMESATYKHDVAVMNDEIARQNELLKVITHDLRVVAAQLQAKSENLKATVAEVKDSVQQSKQ